MTFPLARRAVSVLLVLSCIVSACSAAEVNVTVSKSPKLVDVIDKINHPEDTNATITCTLKSGDLSELTYEWLKDEERILLEPAKYRIATANENYQSTLRVLNLTPLDSGLYSCVAKNRFGEDKISTQLNVQAQLKWLAQPTDLRVSAGKAIRVPCRASGHPPPRIEWRRVDSISERTGGDSIGSELAFDSVAPRHAGLYECRAINGVEEDLVARVKLDVSSSQASQTATFSDGQPRSFVNSGINLTVLEQ